MAVTLASARSPLGEDDFTKAHAEGQAMTLEQAVAKVLTCAVVGLEGALVEVDIEPGLPAFTIVGLSDAAVQEAKE